MQDTRQQILEILRRKHEVTVQELSQWLGLTTVTVRHHLEILRAEGYVTRPEVQRSSHPGRPRHVYRLTSTAADLFPNNYSGLMDALLAAIKSQLPAEQQAQIFGKVAELLAAEAGSLPMDHTERLNYIIEFLNRHGFTAHLETSADGEHMMICVNNCPYHYVAMKHPEICQVDQMTIQRLTGGRLIHKRSPHAYHGETCCYEVHWYDYD